MISKNSLFCLFALSLCIPAYSMQNYPEILKEAYKEQSLKDLTSEELFTLHDQLLKLNEEAFKELNQNLKNLKSQEYCTQHTAIETAYKQASNRIIHLYNQRHTEEKYAEVKQKIALLQQEVAALSACNK